jgi:hypothetical protein
MALPCIVPAPLQIVATDCRNPSCLVLLGIIISLSVPDTLHYNVLLPASTVLRVRSLPAIASCPPKPWRRWIATAGALRGETRRSLGHDEGLLSGQTLLELFTLPALQLQTPQLMIPGTTRYHHFPQSRMTPSTGRDHHPFFELRVLRNFAVKKPPAVIRENYASDFGIRTSNFPKP